MLVNGESKIPGIGWPSMPIPGGVVLIIMTIGSPLLASLKSMLTKAGIVTLLLVL